jgi:ComF family protein
MVVKRKSSESCRRVARYVQSPSKAPSTPPLHARTVRIAQFTSTQRWPHTVAAVSFDVIHQFKYNRQIHLRNLVARWLRAALGDERLRDCRFDVIVPVPLHPARQRERGFNQASLLAQLLSAHTSIPSKPLLKRIRYTTTQTALDRSERMENLHNAFRLRKNADMRGLRVLLIDDVLTTGSTLSECARVLKRAGAISVHAATAARA